MWCCSFPWRGRTSGRRRDCLISETRVIQGVLQGAGLYRVSSSRASAPLTCRKSHRTRSDLSLQTIQARSSVGEHYLDTVGVGSSILPAPTGNRKKCPNVPEFDQVTGSLSATLRAHGVRGRMGPRALQQSSSAVEDTPFRGDIAVLNGDQQRGAPASVQHTIMSTGTS